MKHKCFYILDCIIRY